MRIVQFFIAMTIAVGVYAPDVQAQGGCAQKIIDKCKQGGKEAWNGGGDLGSGMYGGTSSLGNANAEQGKKMGEAAGKCADMKSQCKKCPKQEQKQCEQGLEQAGGEMQAQSASMGDASQALGALAGLAAAAMGMMNKKKEEEDKNAQNQSALQANGQIDCSKDDAYMFPDCDVLLSASCRNAMEDVSPSGVRRCVAFSNRYCNGNVSPPGVTGPGVPYGGSGQGVRTPFCKFVAQYGYCRAGGRDACPACEDLQKQASAACQANPAACLAQNSPDILAAKANQCPGDPLIFGDPSVLTALQNGAGQQQGGPALVGGGGAPPVLPGQGGQPVAGNPGGGVQPVLPPGNGGAVPVVNPGGGGGAGGGAPVNVGTGVGIAGAGTQQPTGGAGGNVNASQGGGGVASGTVISIASTQQPGGNRAVAGQYRITNAGGPAPDVQGQYGPSVFAMGTQAIRNRCAAGQFLHCP